MFLKGPSFEEFVVLLDNKCKKTTFCNKPDRHTYLRKWSGLLGFLDALISNKNTNFLENLAPKLWSYLDWHGTYLW